LKFQVTSGAEALELLLNSERVYEDLQHAFTYLSDLQLVGKPKVKYPFEIMVTPRFGARTLLSENGSNMIFQGNLESMYTKIESLQFLNILMFYTFLQSWSIRKILRKK
jgi:hypothetical protein